MADHEIQLTFATETLVDAVGLVRGVRISASNCPGLVGLWYWLDRDADQLQALEPYRVGMTVGRRGP